MTEASPDRDSSDEHASPEALAQLSLAFRSSLTRYFQRRVSAPAEIDDLVQEVFLRLLVRGGVEDMASVSGYVFETASSVLKDRYRRRVTRHADDHVPMGTDGEEGQDFSAERVHQGRELLHEAAMELLAMPERSTLRQFMAAHASTTKQVPVDDHGMLLDMDTPDEYDRVLECLRSAETCTKEV